MKNPFVLGHSKKLKKYLYANASQGVLGMYITEPTKNNQEFYPFPQERPTTFLSAPKFENSDFLHLAGKY